MKIIYSPKFAREYKKLSIETKIKAEKVELLFRKNPFNPKLKIHKLSGHLKDFWSFSIDYSNRVIFEFAEKDIVYFHSVGNHDIYD